VEKPGTFECISFKSEEVIFLHVVIHSSDNVLFEGRKKVLVKPQKNIILVETDKALYKPGETVKFRIMNLDDELKVIKNEYPQIWLQDPEHNRIAEWLNVKSRDGIVDLSFPLASEAALGEYTISVQQDRAQKTFNVEEYEMTKFELKIEHPPFISTADEKFQLKLCGKYTYGKPVHGKIEITFITLLQFEKKNFSNSSEMRKQQSWVVKTKTLELNESDSSIIVMGEMEEIGTGSLYPETVVLSFPKPGSRLLMYSSAVRNPILLPFRAQTNDFFGISIVTRVKSIEFINLHPFYKRGLPYTGQVTPTGPSSGNILVFSADSSYASSCHSILIAYSCFCALKGTYYLGNDTEENSGQSAGTEESFHWLKPFYSESNSFLEIKAKNVVMPCDQEQEVQNSVSSMSLLFALQVIAKGRILFSGEKQVPILQHENLHGSFSITLTIGNDFLPDIKFLVYALFLDGEVVADVEEFQVAKCFRHKVALDFSSKQEVPGSKVSLDLKAAPGSLCSVQSVDKSVLLMENSTLTADTCFSYQQLTILASSRYFSIPYCLLFITDILSLLFSQLLRMKILTNTKIKKPVSCMQQGFERKMLFSKDSVVDNHVVHADLVPQSDDTKKPKPRTHFPETWIWDLIPVGDEGQASLQVTVPDAITEWNANTFCVADTGFGLSPLATLRVFQPFFVDLSLPYSVTQGETFSLKATVFNYLKDCIQVHTTLKETPELKVDACPGCQFTSCLCADEAKIFVWNVTVTRLEDSHNLCDNRVAVAPLQGDTDTVIKTLLVKPGGILQEKTQNAFLCATDNTVSEEFSLTLPAETLEGSGRATFSVIGDIMGPALQNLDQLLKMPFGCGEQNMVQFAPNIFILQYLKKTKQLDPEIEVTALYFLKTGYQRQLLYKHDDGSYSAFGKSDTQGNTWLTAFVARSFGQASSHIYINKDHVRDAVLWLQKHQLPNGCFQSVGKLFNNDLKGGVDDTLSLTAYIAAALVELQLEKNDTMLDNALHCLKNVTLDKTSLYVKALMAYVFTLTKDMELRQQLLDKLEKETVLQGYEGMGLKFFSSAFLHVSAEHLTSDSSSKDSSSSMIEIVAYILLAHVSKPDFAVNESAVSKLVHWLSKQRNALGGFASTQDTVVSLQALAQYAALFPHEIRDVKVTVKGKEASPLEFHVHENNKLVLHQTSLLAVPGMYTVQATGSGCVYVQSTLYYNTPPPKAEEVFVLDVEPVMRECDGVRKQLDIHVSVSYAGDRETSNMVLVEVEMLSGFIPIKKSVKELENVPLVKKTEIKPDKVTIYLEELDKTSLKLNISVEQDNEVQNLKPATVHVYDYYKPDDHTAREYNFPCSS
ncbi:A2ML1 protein, partial [Penelope pileata]|nr:A2ML1 protein [Penelope pileata]